MKRRLQPASNPPALKVAALKVAAAPELGPKRERGPMLHELYRRAAAQLRKERKERRAQSEASGAALLVADPVRLVHELQVHQVELQMQNAELLETRAGMERLVEKYADLYDFAPVGYFTLASDGTINLVNLTGAKLIGIERSVLVGRSFPRKVSVEFRPAFTAFLKQVFGSAARQTGDFELSGPDRPSRAINVEAQRSPNGQQCSAIVIDSTERKKAADEVRISEIRYRRLFEAAHDGVLLIDPRSRKITDANPFMTKLLGYSHAELLGKELFEIGLLKDEAASQEMFRRLKRDQQIRYEDLPLKSVGGRHQEVEVVANLYQENGQAVIQCNIRDITERKMAADALRRSEALFSALIEKSPVGVYVVDAQFRLQQANPLAMIAFKNVHPLLGRPFAEIVHILWPKRTAAEVVRRFRDTLRTGTPYQKHDFTERRLDLDEQECYEWQIQRVTLPAGELGVVCFFNNITERKRAEAVQRRVAVLAASNEVLKAEIIQRKTVEAALRNSEQQQRQSLEQARNLQAQLRNLSREVLRAQEEERRRISRELHDVIAQTLTGINLRLALLKKASSGDTKGLARNIAHTQRLVEKSVGIVHKFARELRPAVLDDLGLIPALHSYLRDFTTQTGIRTSLTAVAMVESLDAAHRTVLFRVALEALTNVQRHAGASRVEIFVERHPLGICMRITDDGKAFDSNKVFHDGASNRLGLLGMRERLEMVGGSFAIESKQGQGTCVTAVVPIGPPARRPAGHSRRAAGAGGRQRKKP